MSESTAVSVQGQQPQRMVSLLRPIAPTGDIIAAQNEARAFIATALVKGRDYGLIPGTGDRATLLKPGSERICAGFGVRVEPEIIEKEIDHDREVPWQKRKKRWLNRHKGDKSFEWDTESGVSYGLYRYVVRVTLYQIETGLPIGSGIGSASTMEAKYVDRPREAENTVLKMAKKRAQIDAVLTTFGLSDQFTQDLDDFAEPHIVAGEVEAQPAVVLASDAQVAELRELADKIHPTTRADLDRKVEMGLPASRVVEVYTALERLLTEKQARKGRKGAAQQEAPPVAVDPDADPMEALYGGMD